MTSMVNNFLKSRFFRYLFGNHGIRFFYTGCLEENLTQAKMHFDLMQ